MKNNILENRAIDEGGLITSRRRFLKNIAVGSLITMGTPAIANAALRHFPAHKTLAFQNVNTGDKLKLTYFENGQYVRDALKEINFAFRDFRTDTIHPIDPALLDQLFDLKLLLDIHKPFHIISGYRSPATNAKLRMHSHGVAKRSLHMQGRAVDIRLPGIEANIIRNAALKMRRGGVGYYRSSNFVHLDTGAFRTW